MAKAEYTLESLQSLLKSYLESTKKEKLQLEETTNVLNNNVKRLQHELDLANSNINQQDGMLQKLQEELNNLTKQLASKNDELNKVQNKLKSTENDLQGFRDIVENMNTNVQGKLSSDKLLVHLKDVIRENDKLIQMKNDTIAKNEEVIADLRKQIDKLNSKNQELALSIPKDKSTSQMQTQTDETDDELLKTKKRIEEVEAQIEQQYQSLLENKDIIQKLKEENQSLKEFVESAASKQDTSQLEKRLGEVKHHLNALKTVLQQMKESKELESTTMQEDMLLLMENLQKKYMEIEDALLKRNKNLEDIIHTLNKTLNLSSDNISEIQKELLNGEKDQYQFLQDMAYSTDSISYPNMNSPYQSQVSNKIKSEKLTPPVDSKELHAYYISPKQVVSSDIYVSTPPVIKSTTSPAEWSELSDVSSTKKYPVSKNDPEIIKLKRENQYLKNEIKKCKCNKPSVISLPKRIKKKKRNPSVTDLNKQLLDLLGKVNSILNTLNDLENSVLDFHQNINKFCKCNELTNEGGSILKNIEDNMLIINNMIVDSEQDFSKLENGSMLILKDIKGNEDSLSIKQSSDFVQLQSSLLLIPELFKEINLRRNHVTKDFELVKKECNELMRLCDQSIQESKSDASSIQRKNVLKGLPKSVKIFYPKDRTESNTYLMYIPEDTCKCNQLMTPTSSNPQTVYTGSNQLDGKSIGDAPSKGWLTQDELKPVSLSEKSDIKSQIWGRKNSPIFCKECGKQLQSNSDNLSISLKKDNVSFQNQTSEIKVNDVQTSPFLPKTESYNVVKPEIHQSR